MAISHDQFKKITGKSFTGRLRPKYRLFLKTSSPESSNQAKSEPSPVKNIKKQAHRSAKTSPFKKVVPGNSDTDKALNWSPSTDNSKNNNSSKAKRKRKGKISPRDQLALSDKGFKKPQQKEPSSANTGEQDEAAYPARVIRYAFIQSCFLIDHDTTLQAMINAKISQVWPQQRKHLPSVVSFMSGSFFKN